MHESSVSDSLPAVDFTIGNAELNAIDTDEEMNAKIRGLNAKLQEIFNFVIHKWARDHKKKQPSKVKKEIKPFHIFLTGAAGCGKSHLSKTIYKSICKILKYQGGNVEKQRVLLLVETDVAAANIDDTTLCSRLGIYWKSQIYPLNDKQKDYLRNKLSEVKLIVIEKITMVSRKLFGQLKQRLIDIYSCSETIPFAGVSVLVCGDLHQLPSVNPPTSYSAIEDINSATTNDLNFSQL